MSSSDDQQKQKTVKDYVDLIETIARSEYIRLPQDRVSYQEIVEIGAIAVHTLLKSNPERNYSSLYLTTAIKWAIRNELKHRCEWYTLEKSRANNSGEESRYDDSDSLDEKHVVREAIYETIFSVEGLFGEEKNGTVNTESFVSSSEEQREEEISELKELAKNIRGSISKLPNQVRQVVEARFYRNLQNQQIGQSLYVSPLRILRTIQSGLDQVRLEINSDLNKKEEQK